MRKVLIAMLLLGVAMFLMECTEDAFMDNVQVTENEVDFRKGGPPSVEMGNNLSFPVILADGVSLTEIGEEAWSWEVEYEPLPAGLEGDWYAQKVEGNVWQADFTLTTGPTSVTFVDWGDAIESTDPKVGRPYRLELTLYYGGVSMNAFGMELLANPSSKEEIQGTNLDQQYLSTWATITSGKGRMVVQRFEEGAELVWNGSSWNNAYDPEVFSFAPELNVGGKYIFGASKKGWKPLIAGNYRITFYMDDSEVDFNGAQVGNYNSGAPEIPNAPENNKPEVLFDQDLNLDLTFVDVQATGGGGNGGGNGKGRGIGGGQGSGKGGGQGSGKGG